MELANMLQDPALQFSQPQVCKRLQKLLDTLQEEA
jgi:hypothetical protein